MANPRKFSEKIALHNQKQAEETARFEQIMREVSDATNKMNNLTKQHLHINPTLGSFRGGSLPNVNHVASNTVETKTDRPLSHFEDKSGRTDSQVVYRERGRSVGVGPMRSRPIEKRIDTSPYGGAYLSPPPDTNWRRTNSDSALHQSTQDVGQRRHESQILGISFNDKSSEQRPRSCYEDSLVPGINIHPSHTEPGTVQIPIGNNTGSLPDLTSFHFPSPLSTPLDQEDPNSSFSTSPQGASPCTLSPLSLSLRSRPFGATSPQETRVPSPHAATIQAQVQNPSPAQQQFYSSSRLQNLTVGPTSPGGSPPLHRSSLQNHLTIPTIITSSYLHQSKGVTQDHSATVDNYSQPKFVYQNSPLSPSLVNCSLSPTSELSPQQTQQQQQQQQLNALNTYRNSNLNRPSPQNSPGLSVQQYRSASPGDSHNSAPPSPASPVGSPGANILADSNYFINHAQQAAALQQHFEQFNMDWCQLVHSLVESGSGWSAQLQMDTPSSTSISYITSPNSSSTTPVMTSDDGLTQDLGTDSVYFNTTQSQLQYNRNTGNGSTQQTTPQTPNTPSSIPDIILTDFSSSAADDLTKPGLGSTLSGSFESDLFPTDETLRAGLGPIDFDGFQMLTDPDMNVISDPTAEDHFRLDRLDRL